MKKTSLDLLLKLYPESLLVAHLSENKMHLWAALYTYSFQLFLNQFSCIHVSPIKVILLPKKHRITKIIVKYFYEVHLHPGPGLLLLVIRREY